MNVTISERISDVGDRISDVGDTVGHALGDAWQTGASLAHDLVDAAVDAVPGRHQQRRRSAWTVRRVLIAVGIAATIGLLVLAVRRGRQPWADAERDTPPPKAEPLTTTTRRDAVAAVS